jgi:hypothetical protein
MNQSFFFEMDVSECVSERRNRNGLLLNRKKALSPNEYHQERQMADVFKPVLTFQRYTSKVKELK